VHSEVCAKSAGWRCRVVAQGGGQVGTFEAVSRAAMHFSASSLAVDTNRSEEGLPRPRTFEEGGLSGLACALSFFSSSSRATCTMCSCFSFSSIAAAVRKEKECERERSSVLVLLCLAAAFGGRVTAFSAMQGPHGAA